MAKKYLLNLTAEERGELQRLVKKGRVAAWKVRRAQALLQCDQGPDGPAWEEPPSHTWRLESPDSPASHFVRPLSEPLHRGATFVGTGTIVPFAPSSCFVPHVVHSPSALRAPPHTPQDWAVTSTVDLPFVATASTSRPEGSERWGSSRDFS